jgi:hypothetical protein
MLSLQAEALSKSFNISQNTAIPNSGGAPLTALHGIQPWASSNTTESQTTAGC